MMRIQTILILVELDSGHVHQVLAPKEQKEIYAALLRSEEGVLRLSDRMEPVMLKKFSSLPSSPVGGSNT